MADEVLRLTAFGSLMMSSFSAQADVAIVTCNIKHIGWIYGKDFATLGEIGNSFDLLAVQEVMR